MTSFHFVVLGTQRLLPDDAERAPARTPDCVQMRTVIERALPDLEQQLRSALSRLRVDLGDSVLVFEPGQVRLYPLIGEPR